MNRILTIAIAVLWICAFVLFVKINSLPEIDDQVDTQVSLNSLVTNLNFDRLKNSVQAAIRSGSFSKEERVVQSKRELEQVSVLADTLSNYFDKVESGNASAEIIAHKISEIKKINKFGIIDTIPFFKELNRINLRLTELNSISDRRLKKIVLGNIRDDAFYFVRSYVDSLDRMVAGTVYYFSQELSHQEDTWKKGLIAFNPPRVMEVGEHERIQVRISKDLQHDILQQMHASEKAEVDSLLVGDVMIVRMTGDDFEINPFDEEEQGVTDAGYTQWEFDIVPKSSGSHSLFVKVGIVYSVPGLGPTKKFFPVYEKQIQIHVNTWKKIASFASERWEFLISTFLIPALTWAWSRIRKKKQIA